MTFRPILLPLVVYSLLPIPTMGASAILENDTLSIKVHDTGAIGFLDKQNSVHWGSPIPGWVRLSQGNTQESCDLLTSKVSIRQGDNTLNLYFKGISGTTLSDPHFAMDVNIILQENHFDIAIERLDSSLHIAKIEYPAHILTVKSGIENGYIVVPNLQGILIPSRYDAGFMRFGQNIWDMIADIEKVWTFESGMLNMPWFGASRETSSVLATVMTPSDCQLRMIANAVVGDQGRTVNAHHAQNPGTRLSSLTPIWLSSKKVLAYTRKIRLELVSNGYVGMAKRYRLYARQSGRYVTLKEKIKKNPEYAKIVGAPDIKIYVYTNRVNNPYYKAWSEPVLHGYTKLHTTFDQVAQISDELKEMGVQRCMILLGGWNRMGYDREHVDMWPPAEGAGGIEGLKRACERVKQHGYLFALHDNYNDFYPDAPSYDEKYIIKEMDGSLRRGGIWDGGLCHVVCSARQKELLERNLSLVLASVPLNGYYFDVVTSVSPYECYDPNHPNTRRQDLQHRHDLFHHVRDHGLVVGGERGADWAMPAAAFYEGMQGGGTGYHRGLAYRVGLTVPLFYLVYHDCVVGYWQHGTPHGREDHANHVLHDLLSGQPSSWSIVYDQWRDLKPLIRETYELLGRFHERTAFYPMTDHRILTADAMVQTSCFGDGSQVWVNYGITSYREDTVTIPPKGFMLKIPGEPYKMATVDRRIRYLQLK